MDRAMIHPRRKNGIRRDRKGVTIVEFALIAPIMFTIIFACIEFTRFVMIRGLAEDAAYEAARTIIVPGATVAEATAQAQQILGSLGVSSITVTVTPYSGNTAQTQINDNTTEVRVNVSVPFSANSLLVPRYFSSSTTVNSTTRLYTERYDGDYSG
jgi:Flp pilus assembly protein TadG